MVWGCMSATSFGKICFSKRLTVYQDVIDHFFIPYIEDKFEDNVFIFQHDPVPPDTEKSTKEWFMEKLPVLDWPANSPGANPMGNLWGILKRLRKYYQSNLEELKQVINKVCASVSLEICNDLIDSFPE